MISEELYDYIFDTVLVMYQISRDGPESKAAQKLCAAILFTISPSNELTVPTIKWWKEFADEYRRILKEKGLVIVDGKVVDDISS